ncbi:ABC transporter substrate-binding protein [Nonomuraea phyllanthi]|uniref:ABC transporter substrate-binding protein n=1 Tax=Nonomuraea phyllanthi TaxID=2219224 RepID=A0A5C4WSR8_9ACTN|nr:ABC transporter substrate-binding protein [Nonomuraea phyllanthi]
MVCVGAPVSLSGRLAMFGAQVRLGLEVWQRLRPSVDLLIEDDHGEPRSLDVVLPRLAGRCDLLLGPYSTLLMRRAGDIATALDRLIWNHGGAGDDVQTAHPRHVVSVPTPASRYAEPFVRHLAETGDRSTLRIVHGKGGFARQAAEGASRAAHEHGIPVVHGGPVEDGWNLFCAGSFEEDVELVKRARHSPAVCAVAAGVREFASAVDDPRGIYGVGQWFPGGGHHAALGVSEREFVAAYQDRTGEPPSYPAVQAVAAAILATHCADLAGGHSRAELRAVVAGLETSTLFGDFAIDPRTGRQTGHRTVLTRWGEGGPVAV